MHRCTGSQAQASVAFWVIHVESRSAFRFFHLPCTLPQSPQQVGGIDATRCTIPLHRETPRFFRRKRKKGLHFRNRCAIISHSPNRKCAEQNAPSSLENARVSRFSPLFLTQFGVIRACSSAGRAFGSHPRGREFESLQVHQTGIGRTPFSSAAASP